MAQCYFAWRPLAGEDGHRVGRQLLQQLYQTHVGEPMPPIVYLPGGKPCFAEGRWHFSVSHSRAHAFCVLCDVPVGVDGEELCRRVRPVVAQKGLSAGERAQYDRAADKNRALLTLWVLKEAEAKLYGRGIGFHPNHTDFRLDDPRVREVDGCLVAIITQEEKENVI